MLDIPKNLQKLSKIKFIDLFAGIGKAIYTSGTGRYLNFINKECTYAVNYLNPKKGFYKHICKG